MITMTEPEILYRDKDIIVVRKPAGMAYIGISYKDETRVVKVWRGNRGRFWNRNFFVLRMLNEVYQSIK